MVLMMRTIHSTHEAGFRLRLQSHVGSHQKGSFPGQVMKTVNLSVISLIEILTYIACQEKINHPQVLCI